MLIQKQIILQEIYNVAWNTTMFFIIEDVKKTIPDFLEGTAKVL